MKNDERIARHSANELADMRKRDESRTDWPRVNALSDADVESSIDRDDEGAFDWNNVHVGLPGPKQQLTVRFDAEVIDWFRAQGSGYQTKMNAVLRSYVDAQKRRSA